MEKILQRFGAGVGLAVGAVSAAHAALPTEVTQAISDAGSDLTAAAGAVIASLAAFWGLRKLGSKMGWW